LRETISSKRFDNLFENNVPFAGLKKVNLLRTLEIPKEV
jgi:hypothetical protein